LRNFDIFFVWIALSVPFPAAAQALAITGTVSDPQGKALAGATIHLVVGPDELAQTATDAAGQFRFEGLIPGTYLLRGEFTGFAPASSSFALPGAEQVNLQFWQMATQHDSVVITAISSEPSVELRNSEVFNKTLFSRDDQVLQQLNAGISAGQHEGGGKSLEIRRFGFNLDHGGVNGGLKVLLDNVAQNQGTQGHGQGYLGSLKSLSPELIQGVTVINGPFRPEYGDFSGLGVVHIRQRESLPDAFTLRLQGGNFDSGRGFLAWSPSSAKVDSYLAYEGSYTNGPFVNPSRYRRDNVNGNYTRTLNENEKLGFRILFGRNDFFSSGQLPMDLVEDGQLDRFGFLDPAGGGRTKLGTASGYYSRTYANGANLRLDGFVSRSLFDLYSNFTFYLADPVRGDGIQQHDSRLQDGANAHFNGFHKIGGLQASFTAGGNFHDNWINVGLYPRVGREPFGVTNRTNAHVTNGAGYLQESVSLLGGRMIASGGLRYDLFRYGLLDRIASENSGVQSSGRWQGKGSLVFTPSRLLPMTLHANYGRGINSADARGVVLRPQGPRLGTTDFYQTGISSHLGRVSLAADVFVIDHSNEQVYIPDDGSFELRGPSRAYGFEAKASIDLTRRIGLSGGITKVANAFYRGGDTREYISNAPRFTGNAALTVANWHGWSGSVRMRAINHYRLDGFDPAILALGHTVFDVGISRRISQRMDVNLGIDNAGNRSYWETQNYFESRVSPLAPLISRVHATPAFPLTVVAGITLRLGGK